MPDPVAEDVAALELAVAKAIWVNREETFPAFTRLSWEDATELARRCCLADARVAIRVVRGMPVTPAMKAAAESRIGNYDIAHAAIVAAMAASPLRGP